LVAIVGIVGLALAENVGQPCRDPRRLRRPPGEDERHGGAGIEDFDAAAGEADTTDFEVGEVALIDRSLHFLIPEGFRTVRD
jgi:hypothetical protein